MLRSYLASQPRRLGQEATTFVENQFVFAYELGSENRLGEKTRSNRVGGGKEWGARDQLQR